MTSEFIYKLGENWAITSKTKDNNKLYSNAVATPVYCLIGNSKMLTTDIVNMIFTVNGHSYHKMLQRYTASSGEIIVDGEMVDGWKVVSNGEELSMDIDTEVEATISFEVKRYSSIDGTTLLMSQTTGSTTEYVYPAGTYTPMIEPTDAEILEGLINSVNNTKQNKTDLNLITTNKTIVGAINGLDIRKQDKADETLNTEDKTVVGSINELKTRIDNIVIDVDEDIVNAINTHNEADSAHQTKFNDVVAIAEGKTSSYVISDVTNVDFNSSNDTITLAISGTITDILGNIVNLSDLKVGDIINITETDVPDRWVGSKDSSNIVFYKMETNKVDISVKVDKTNETYKLYGTDSSGNQTVLPYDTYPAGKFVRRDDNSQIGVPLTPTQNSHATSKKYVDDECAKKQDKNLVFTNTAVAQADWQSDSTYTDYGYKATITLSGATADMIPTVVFGGNEASSGNYLSVAESYAGGIYIWSKVNDAITIPTIILQKAGA